MTDDSTDNFEDDAHDERRHQVVGAVFLVGLVLILVPFAFDSAVIGTAVVEARELPSRISQPAPVETGYAPPQVSAEPELAALATPLLQATDDAGFRTDTGTRFGDPSFLPNSDPRAQGWTAWGVQVGSFGEVENAREVRRLLRSAGYHVALAEALVDGRRITRVAVGPLLSREEAVRLQEVFAMENGLQGVLVKFEN